MSGGRYMHPTLAHDMAETVSLYLGKPANCCLKFARGLRRDTVRGPRVLFTLTDDRKLWVDPPVADRIEALVGAGEWFHICKRKSPGNSQVEVYDVWTGERGQPAAEMAPAEAWENNIEETLQESVKRVRAKKASAAKIGELNAAPAIADVDKASDNSHATPAKRRTQLAAALETAVDACYHAQEYGKTLGYTVAFTSEDIRACAITLIINKQRGNG